MIEQLNKCTIEVIIFHNETSGYTVMKCRHDKFTSLITVVGSMNGPRTGSTFDFAGEWKVNPKYGRQFVFDSFREVFPTTVEGIAKYLSSGLIKGVGPDLAKKIIDTFGENTIEIIDNSPEMLLEVKGIGEKKLAQIKESWANYRELQNIMIFLKEHDISTSLAMKIYEKYRDKSIEIITDNPYRLTEIEGVGFITADGAARKMGFALEDKHRLNSGIIYVMKTFESDGHCFVYKKDLLEAAHQILEVSKSLIESVLYELIDAEQIIRDEDDALYLKVMYFTERKVARKLRGLASSGFRKNYTLKDIKKELNGGYFRGHFLDNDQLEAIRSAVNNKVSVITGGPGTGKTTAIQGIIQLYGGEKIFLAAPTGRAAKKLADTTGREASTIHRLLGFSPAGCDKDENNPLEGDLLIVDECSMIDINLMNLLLKAVPLEMSLVLVGDIDQLPSIGPGRVFADIIDSGLVECTRLSALHRQGEGSGIAFNARRINEGNMPYVNYNNESDFAFTEIQDQDTAAIEIVSKCEKLMKRDDFTCEYPDVQVLAPMRKGIVGINNLNILLQEALNPVLHDEAGNPLLIRRGETEYRLNDKVMQIRNNYSKSIFNGDIGRVSNIDRENNKLTVTFDEARNVDYEYIELEDLVLAYAITIHKSQGSEYETVIMPIMKAQFIMLQRNLLYTAVTRAKNKLIMIGEAQAVYIAVKNNKISQRNTRLVQRLKDYELDDYDSERDYNDDDDD
ncbi:MAG: ATP-dependent RecD-like DNA helicase [Synergistaceae bacterium]|nr:ATP-dependent RecD-like DNA helicase [Synergistaceae bacterium]